MSFVKRLRRIIEIIFVLSVLTAQNRDEVIELIHPVTGTVIDTNFVDVEITVADFFTVGAPGCTDCDGYIQITMDGTAAGQITSAAAVTVLGLSEGSHFVEVEALDPSGASFSTVVYDSASFTVDMISEQNFCPAENISVLGGDGQNIVMWDEPLNPSTVLLTIEVVTDTWQGETSWDLVNVGTGELVASIAAGDLTEANTSYTWDIEIPHGNYSFTIYDSFGDGIYAPNGYALSLNGVSIYSCIGTGWTGTEETIEFNTTDGRFTAFNNSFVDPIPLDKGSNYDLGWQEGMALTGLVLIESGSFNVSRDVPEECGTFTHYAVYSSDGTELGTTTELEYTHVGLTNGVEYCYYVTVVYEEGMSDPTGQACGTPAGWDAEAPSNLMSFPGDEEMVLIWMAPGGGGGGTQGDVIENPFVVTGIPFEDNGTTEGFNNDYDETCPYTGSTSNDVVYMFSTSGGTYDFSLCESGYDTKIYIYDINQMNIACNDDACNDSDGNPFRSLLESVTLDPGLYYVIVDGYGGQSGEYQLLIDFSGTRSYNYNTTEKDPDEGVSNSRTEYDFLDTIYM